MDKTDRIIAGWDKENGKAFDTIKKIVESETAHDSLKQIIEDDIKKTMSKDLNNLSHWFPKIKDCGIQVPETLIFDVPENTTRAFWMEKQDRDRAIVTDWLKDIYPQIKEMAHPYVFLKNGNFSNKFEANDCIVKAFTLGQIVEAVININYTSMMFGAGGVNELVAREFIGFDETVVPCIYNGLPFRPEFRVFYDFDTHKVLYSANYWDWDYCHDKITRNMTDKLVYEAMYPLIKEAYNAYHEEVEAMVGEAMKNVTGLTGQWSIDILQKKYCRTVDDNGLLCPGEFQKDIYYLIDMAIAQSSAYWKG